MKKDFFSSVMAVTGLIGAGAGLTETGYIFAPQSQSQPTQPQNPPRSPSQPGQNQPPTPGQPQPNQPAQPGQPSQPNPRQPDRLPQDRRDDRRERAPGESAQRPQRPFAFQSPQAEARFNESAKRLQQMEQRMLKSNQELLRRLGEARTLSGERQNAAVMELLQQFLTDQSELQRYLAQSRSAISGEALDDGLEGEGASDPTPRNQPGSDPADRPRTPDSAPRTPDSAPRTPPVAPGTGNPR